jgi:hypothetical protein
LVDSSVLDVEEANIEKGIQQLLEESGLGNFISRQGDIQYGYLLERHGRIFGLCRAWYLGIEVADIEAIEGSCLPLRSGLKLSC